jgi:hypothetical protein
MMLPGAVLVSEGEGNGSRGNRRWLPIRQSPSCDSLSSSDVFLSSVMYTETRKHSNQSTTGVGSSKPNVEGCGLLFLDFTAIERFGGANIIPLPCGLSWLECNDADGVAALFTWAFVSDGETCTTSFCSRVAHAAPAYISISNMRRGYIPNCLIFEAERRVSVSCPVDSLGVRDVLSLIADCRQDLFIMVVSDKCICCNRILPRSKNVLLRPEKHAREQKVGYTKHAVRQQNCPTRIVTGRLLSLGEACLSDQYEIVSMNCPMQIDFLHLPGSNIPAPVPADTHRKNRIHDGTERLSS